MKRITFVIVLAIFIAESVFSQEFDKKNLLYRVIPNESNAVELLGFEKKPKEELIIPEEVSYKEYFKSVNGWETTNNFVRD